MVRISVTEAARRFSDLLNRVLYQGETFELERSNKVIARLSPASPPSRVRAADLNELFRRLPKLGDDGEAFAKDVESTRARLDHEGDPWA